MQEVSNISFILHDEQHNVKSTEVPPETSLLQYLRDHEHLKGTKYMCLEGGCGACIVSITKKHPITRRTMTFSVNSCLVSVHSCQEWQIQTADGIGNKKSGYHPVQEVLANFSGTQCGYCSPGMVMNMHALYESNSNLTMEQIETSFGGNMCRCTGYRPILTAFKSIAKDADKKILGEYPDIEDLDKCEKRNCQETCRYSCKKKPSSSPYLTISDSKWFKAYSVNEIFDILRENPDRPYQLVAGNTAKGVYHNFNDNARLYVDITSVANLLNDAVMTSSFMVGANKTLTETIEVFEKTASLIGFGYLAKLADHIKLVAHTSVRNLGTLAGNLSIKHRYNEFPSDIFLILETVGARMTIVDSGRKEIESSLQNYLIYDMNQKVIKNIILPKLDSSYIYQSYKITPRAQNAHAIVNAGFLLRLDNQQNIREARIVYGGINPSFVHAANAEKYIRGKNVFKNETLQGVFKVLDREIQPDDTLPQPSPRFRKQLAIALFYKFILSIAPDKKISPKNNNGGSLLIRPISRGVQDFQSNQSLYPLTQPIPKLEALRQTSGEVKYIIDIPHNHNQLYAAFVTAKAPANSVIVNIDSSKALEYEGVVSFYCAKDIPGLNTFVPLNTNYPRVPMIPDIVITPEELFCSGIVKYYFQPVGIVVAKSHEIAEKAADLVNVTYNAGTSKPLLTIKQILDTGATGRIFQEASRTAKGRGTDVKRIVRGTFNTSWQYHYHMETQICAVFPKEDGLDIYPGSQWMDIIQVAVASILNINASKINIHVQRIGGAFGGKVTRNALISCAAALAAYKLRKPVKMHLPFTKNMNIIGKRFPSYAEYEVGLNDNGVIQYLITAFYLDYASGGNEPIVNLTIDIFSSSYKNDTWNVTGYNVRTDNHAGVWTRAPGNTTIMAMIETIMEHIAMEINVASLDIRLRNITQNKDSRILQYINECRQWADYDNRLKVIEKFNQSNRWRKKGLSLVPMTYALDYAGGYSSTVTIYTGDGSVSVSHGGIEIGQGIHTKVVQVCAYALGISLDMVTTKCSNNFVSANNFVTSTSITSEAVCYATLRACQTLLERMRPVRERMGNPAWKDLVKECHRQYVELVATHMFSPNDPPRSYNIYGVCVTEVEVDILTGVHQVNRVDLLEDAGTSLSPIIDIGQVEGAFIMGLGFWTTEKLVFNEDGRLLTNRTWNYKIPGALDIPIDFRVRFPSNNPNPTGVLNSKATAEPPLCLACSIPIAIRQAVASARSDANSNASRWYPIDGPSDIENTFLNSLNDYTQYTL